MHDAPLLKVNDCTPWSAPDDREKLKERRGGEGRGGEGRGGGDLREPVSVLFLLYHSQLLMCFTVFRFSPTTDLDSMDLVGEQKEKQPANAV
jgi:hypothetical protein